MATALIVAIIALIVVDVVAGQRISVRRSYAPNWNWYYAGLWARRGWLFLSLLLIVVLIRG
ncbi:MAG: hypothetical protein IPG59_11955 [Candidatus Melainabacteria bacterium]|nr:MAG: hypothetical protein IPG59_11955 [Candidatus Melainabacteria bacterium]